MEIAFNKIKSEANCEVNAAPRPFTLSAIPVIFITCNIHYFVTL